VAAAVAAAAAAGVRCVLNPAPVIPVVAGLLRYGPLLTPNGGELADLADAAGLAAQGPTSVQGHARSPAANEALVRDGVLEQARKLVARTGAAVVVTLGGDGVLAVAPDGTAEHLPPHPTVVHDTTGAGDTFNGVLVARLAVGDEFHCAVRVANVAAALSVAHAGARAGMPTAAAIVAALRT
jgi:ribokinase